MKRCPRCGQIYSDDLLYCLQDGNELLPQYEETETPTVVRPASKSGNPYLKYLAIALLAFFAIGIVGAVAAYVVWSKLGGGGTTAGSSPTPTPTIGPTRTPSPRNSETPNRAVANLTPHDGRDPDDLENRKSDTTEPAFTDPATTRITFRRGRESESVSGRVRNGRDFVLRTLAGQYLTARVSSDRGCVTFAGGDTVTDFPTTQGDSRVSIVNNCPAPVRFRLTVAVR